MLLGDEGEEPFGLGFQTQSLGLTFRLLARFRVRLNQQLLWPRKRAIKAMKDSISARTRAGWVAASGGGHGELGFGRRCRLVRQ
jgi:hypothetical protein